MNLKSKIREIADFPAKGISFKDITTLLKSGDAFSFAANEIYEEFNQKRKTLEARQADLDDLKYLEETIKKRNEQE